MGDPVFIRLHADFAGGVRSKPGSTTWVKAGGVCEWPRDEFAKPTVSGANAGRWSVLGAPAPSPEPEAAASPAAAIIPQWLSDYPGGDWRDLVKVARSLGCEKRKKDEAVAFLASLERDGQSLSRAAFDAILADLEDD